MNTPSDYPVGLMVDLRERMVRIETKLDTQAETNDRLSETFDKHASRLTTLETDSNNLKSQVRTVKWVGGIVVTAVTLFGDKLSHMFH